MNTFSPQGNGVYEYPEDTEEYTHMILADAIKRRPHLPEIRDLQIGFDLYVAGFSISFCDNDEQCRGWHGARSGEADTVSAEIREEKRREEERRASLSAAEAARVERLRAMGW